MAKFIGRKPEKEAALPSLTLPGDVKDRLQIKPLTPAKKKPSGENWTKFRSKDGGSGSPTGRKIPVAAEHLEGDIASQGPAFTDDGKTTLPRYIGKMPQPTFEAGYDDVNAQEHAMVQERLANNGAISDRNAMSDYATETHNEHLYEEIEDKQTGKKSLLFRNNLFDRY